MDTMDTRELLRSITTSADAIPPQWRLQLIEELARRRRAAAINPANHLSVLPGRGELQAVIGNRALPTEVRCQAAAVLAETDGRSALATCVDLL